MFAFGLWDGRRRELFMARDRLGKKPLYYLFDKTRLLFASEPKAILACPGVPAQPDPEAVREYLTFGYVPSPLSAFKGMRKLAPAHYLRFRDGQIEVRRYWGLKFTPKLRIDEQEACEEIIRRLKEAVKLRMVSDVPLGAFLSGGMDSSAVVALMSGLSSKPVKTFSIGFKEPEYDETPYARIVAQKFGTEHHEFQVEPDATAILQTLVWHYNEPYADSSALPTFYLSKLARQYVTVALNGDAGDENFGGYQRYFVNLLANRLRLCPSRIRRLAGEALCRGYEMIGSSDGRKQRLRTLAGAVAAGPWLGYAALMSLFGPADRTALLTPEFSRAAGSVAPEERIVNLFRKTDADNILDATLYADVSLYLPDDLLTKVDIASMAVGLEARSPMVDHEFMEFVARLPAHFKLKGGTGKDILKHALRGLLPSKILERRKQGFSVPLERWFRGRLRPLLREVLESCRFVERGYFNSEYVRRLIDEHESGRKRWHPQLWSLLMLELWHREFIDKPARLERPADLAPVS